MMTPAEFEARLSVLAQVPGYDPEGAHAEADALMCDILEGLGYEKGVELYRTLTKWYA